MPFTKLIKTPAYFSRYQTPYRRRREGKTDYYARKRLITQHKAKYNSPKYRLVVRFTNKDIIAQIVSSQISGDIVLSAAYAHELPNYGIEHGLTNWAAAYAVGLLVARRTLQKLGLDETYTGVEEADGEFTLTEAVEDGPRPFKCYLDVGLHRTTTGARIFGVLKGASDGGLHVPHSEKRYPGYDIESKELDADLLRKYIVAGHVAEYMETLADDDEEKYRQVFKGYLEDNIEADGIEDIYVEAHEKIREDPSPKPTAKKSKEEYAAESKKYKAVKLTTEERLAKRQAKIASLVTSEAVEEEEEEDEE
ncbi:60S ribosomal protein uL18 [Lipomyces oligophaga]|uniref:60S ribosomal protein uL18 n=1 Tax=Lipomyces oligophaga TaxID=45792 RepID=UPI0034CE5601